jgi:hypothetical protein
LAHGAIVGGGGGLFLDLVEFDVSGAKDLCDGAAAEFFGLFEDVVEALATPEEIEEIEGLVLGLVEDEPLVDDDAPTHHRKADEKDKNKEDDATRLCQKFHDRGGIAFLGKDEISGHRIHRVSLRLRGTARERGASKSGLGFVDIKGILLPSDANFADGRFGVYVKGDIFEHAREYRTKATSACFAAQGLIDDVGIERRIDIEVDACERKLLAEGGDEVVLEDGEQGVAVEGAKGDDAVKAGDQFGKKAVLLEVSGLFDFVFGVRDGDLLGFASLCGGGKAEARGARKQMSDQLEAGKSTAGDEGDVCGGHHDELLVAAV